MGKEGDHEFVVACKIISCSPLHRGALHDVDARSIVLDHVEVGCDKVINGVSQIAGNGEGFEEDFGQQDCGTYVEIRSAFKGGDD